jgi:alkylhydroperoxidase family enzyme
MAVRIPFPKDEDLDPEVRDLLAVLPLNLVRALANAPVSLKEFMDMGGSILMRSAFDARKREIAILRVAHVTKATYVWHHHVAIGKTTGITDDEIQKIACDGLVHALDQ